MTKNVYVKWKIGMEVREGYEEHENGVVNVMEDDDIWDGMRDDKSTWRELVIVNGGTRGVR